MPKLATSSIGIDLGTHTLKAVHLTRQGTKIVLDGFAVREIGRLASDPEEFQHHLKLLIQEVGGSAKAVTLAVSDDSAILRLIEQPATPLDIMRSGLKLNGKALLHEECGDFVLDCDVVPDSTLQKDKQKFLVGGIHRARIKELNEAFNKLKLPLNNVQIAPVSLLNAFEYAHLNEMQEEAFILADIGHQQTVLVGGSKGSLVMIRNITYGGQTLVEDLTMDGAIDRDSALLLVEQGDAGMTDATRASLETVGRELISSIGFFEGQRDTTVSRLYLSGGCSRAEMVLQILSDEINLPCEVWDPLERCQINLPSQKQDLIQREARNLNVAFGAAVESLINP